LAVWRNPTGRPLASADWLDAHHRAKLVERRRFAEMLASYRPRTVVDLGCGTGLWLELLDEVLPAECELVGVDTDVVALKVAEERSRNWRQRARFEQVDFDAEPEAIPAGDMILAFNIFPYVADPARLLKTVAGRGGALAVRQYDGAALRFGPMEGRLRALIENSLRASVSSSQQFRHYDMDRVFAFLASSPFSRRRVEFELFARVTPYPEEFLAYYEGMMRWTMELLSEDAAEALQGWLTDPVFESAERYFFEVDLTAVVS
jgi:SAM-dependent methyltransferase